MHDSRHRRSHARARALHRHDVAAPEYTAFQPNWKAVPACRGDWVHGRPPSRATPSGGNPPLARRRLIVIPPPRPRAKQQKDGNRAALFIAFRTLPRGKLIHISTRLLTQGRAFTTLRYKGKKGVKVNRTVMMRDTIHHRTQVLKNEADIVSSNASQGVIPHEGNAIEREAWGTCSPYTRQRLRYLRKRVRRLQERV